MSDKPTHSDDDVMPYQLPSTQTFLPKVSLPSIPKVSLPSIPKVSLPSIPKVSLPSIPKVSLPFKGYPIIHAVNAGGNMTKKRHRKLRTSHKFFALNGKTKKTPGFHKSIRGGRRVYHKPSLKRIRRTRKKHRL
jgi:hypothetical protein